MPLPFDPSNCDLCGSPDDEVLVHVPTGRAMRSDLGSVAVSLVKRACARCGLVRSGGIEADLGLEGYYAEQYTVGLQQEHCFYSPEGPRRRSVVFGDWFREAAPDAAWRQARRVLEIGAGSGRLLGELAQRFPGSEFVGFEPHREAAARARGTGLAVYDSWSEVGTGFDLAYSVAVVEHVASPSAFLRDIATRLRPGGRLLLSQPTQDVPSYDVFFVDHLHHFGSAHLKRYALKCGFDEETVLIGHPLMPNFSLHLWRRLEAPVNGEDSEWSGPKAVTTCAETAQRVLQDMARVDALLVRLLGEGRRVAVFGLREVYWLARCYSTVGDFPFVCGLDDEPDRPEYADLGFPVLRPEDCRSLGVQDVILAMNVLYYPAVRERLGRLGLVPYPLLGGA